MEGKEVHRVTPETITETDHVFSEAGELLSHIPIHSGRKFLIIPKQLFKDGPQKLTSSRSKMFSEIGVLKDIAVFTGKNLCLNPFLIMLQAWCFPVNIIKFLRTVFFM